MVRERDSHRSEWLALTCRSDGTIVEVLRDDFAIAKRGANVTSIVEEGSAEKIGKLVRAVANGECCVDWQLHLPPAAGRRAATFVGARAGELVILFGASAAGSMSRDVYAELSRLNNDLVNREREIARKTAALERVSAEKTRLMAIAAHDLRNPLTIVASYADLMRLEGAIPEDQKPYLEEISRSSKFMMELVEEMLDAARFESGFTELNLEELDLVRVARHAATINRLRADRKLIAVAFECAVEHAIIRADSVKLRQIINNLVVNAVKFSPAKTTVTIRVKRAPALAVLEVEDQGIGISAADLTKIFEPFATAAGAGTAGEKNTGLGLSIVKQLTEMHGGTVSVESEEERGSIFRIAFPAVD